MDDRSGSGSVAATLRGMSGLSVPSVHDDGADVPASWQAIDEMVPVRADADRPSAALAQALAKGRAEQAEQEATLERLRAEMSSLERLIDRSGGVTDEVVQLEQSVAHLQGTAGGRRRPSPSLTPTLQIPGAWGTIMPWSTRSTALVPYPVRNGC